MLAVGGKRDGTIHVANERARCAAEHGSLIEDGDGVLFFIAADEIEITAVGGEGDAEITSCGGRNDLRVAAGLDVAQLQSLQAVFIHDLREIFSVGRNCGERRVAIVREIFDGEMLKGNVCRFLNEFVNAEAGCEENDQSDEASDSRAEFVFLRDLKDDGAAAGRWRREFRLVTAI